MNRDELIQIGQRIKSTAKFHGIKQITLAGRTGINEQHIGQICRGQCEAGIGKIIRIAEVLDVDLHWLLTGQSYGNSKGEDQ